MDIKKRLKKLKKRELENLARQLKATGYSRLDKQALIEHITANYTEQEIKAIIRKRIKWLSAPYIFGYITTFALILTVIFFWVSEKGTEKQTETFKREQHKSVEKIKHTFHTMRKPWLSI